LSHKSEREKIRPLPNLQERVDRHDREIAANRKLVHAGMKMLVKSEEEHRAMRVELRQLAAAQRETDRQLQALIRTLRGGNGHSRRQIDIQ
jgi:hypothetical protein